MRAAAIAAAVLAGAPSAEAFTTTSRVRARQTAARRSFHPTAPRGHPAWTREAQRVPYTDDDGRVDSRGIYEGRHFDTSEKDGCGVGFIAQPENAGPATHSVMSRALNALGCMEHRGACSRRCRG